jgi:redox-sensing transcriptional repressor
MSISDPAVGRLPLYEAIASEAVRRGEQYISSTTIAGELRLSPILVRKDLESTGIIGVPRRGFPAAELLRSLEASLAWGGLNKACLIGTGRLGATLLEYPLFARYGLNILAAFDKDPQKIGRRIAGKIVQPLARLRAVVRREAVLIAILTVPPEAAQEATDLAVRAGVRGIWNFTPVKLNVPPEVIIQRVELAASLAILSKKLAEAMRLPGIAPKAPKTLDEVIQFNI